MLLQGAFKLQYCNTVAMPWGITAAGADRELPTQLPSASRRPVCQRQNLKQHLTNEVGIQSTLAPPDGPARSPGGTSQAVAAVAPRYHILPQRTSCGRCGPNAP